MSNGWSVEAEKDKTSSGVLKLNGALATKGTEVHSAMVKQRHEKTLEQLQAMSIRFALMMK